MTEQEFLVLEPREQNALVAEKVMELCVHKWGKSEQRGSPVYWVDTCEKCGETCNTRPYQQPPDERYGPLKYSTSIAPAWQVVEKMHDVELGHYEKFDETLKAYPLPIHCLEADIAARVICIAALKAVGVIE